MKTTTEIRPDIQALRQHIQLTAEQLAQRSGTSDGGDGDGLGALIYLGNHHDAVPRDLIIDPILQGDEVRTWMLMKIHVANPMLATRIPSQDWLMETLQCSRPIVSRHIQVLRALRWITLCAEVRGADGRYRGVVYAQHDQPLDLAETLHLDSSYLDFLEQPTKGDVLKRLQAIKRSVLAHTDHLVMTKGQSLSEAPTHLQRLDARLKSHISPDPLDTHLSCVPQDVEPESIINMYGDSSAIPDTEGRERSGHVKNIDTDEPGRNNHVKDFYMVETPEKGRNHHVKNIDMVPLSSSSSLYKKNTTTTPPTPPSNLRFPKAVSKSDRQIAYAAKKLTRLPEDKRQYALDWLADRVRAGELGADKPVCNPIQYLEWIVRNILEGTLPESSYGMREPVKPLKPTGSVDDQKAREEAKRQWAEHMRTLGREVDPETGMVVQSNAGGAM